IPLQKACQRIQMPKPLQISLENTLEPFHSFLKDANLFSQYLDLYIPLLLICQRIHQAAEDREAPSLPIFREIAEELRDFNTAFQARFRSSYLRSESTETTLEFKAHTVMPLDSIQCLIDCFTSLFAGLEHLAGFPVISVLSSPRIHTSVVFAVELNSFQLQFPENLPLLFHEFGHLYCRFGGPSRPGGTAQETVQTGHRLSVMDFDQHQTRELWRSFAEQVEARHGARAIQRRYLRELVAEIVSDLMLLTVICRNDWDLFLWYTLLQIETFPEQFHSSAGRRDTQDMMYVELLLRLFVVRLFWRCAATNEPKVWRREMTLDSFQELAEELERSSRKLRQFSAEGSLKGLVRKAWRLLEALIQPELSLAPAAADRHSVAFQADSRLWLEGTWVERRREAVATMFPSILFHYYQQLLLDQVSIAMETRTEDQLQAVFRRLGLDASVLGHGRAPVGDLLRLLGALAWDDALDPQRHLEELREAPWDGLPALGTGDPEHFEPQDARQAYAYGYGRATRALTALVRYFYRHNTAGSEASRYLFRDPETGRPEPILDGKSQAPEAPGLRYEDPPLPIVIDSRGGLFCRSTAMRQETFQFRNAVIRELADTHYRLRSFKMQVILESAERYLRTFGGPPPEPTGGADDLPDRQVVSS
ncbi:MAG: hypothetical protein KDD47_24500, partial [Acidobacteria bacterium]|nr:hypothetical protein [Acidobacteriota bacterium]